MFIPDTLQITRVANGWIMAPVSSTSEFTHVATTPDDVARYVAIWTRQQNEPFTQSKK